MNMLTMKFGGTSVGNAKAISNVCQIVRTVLADETEHVAIVVSAMSKVTNMLQAGVEAAANNDLDEIEAFRQHLYDRHYKTALALLSEQSAATVMEQIDPLIEDFNRFCHSIAVLGEATPRAYDYIMGIGERMSVRLVAATLNATGVKAGFIEATQLITTDDRFRDAAPDMETTRDNIKRRLLPLLERGVVPVVTGFIGATPQGITTTLGRGGSDYSAAIIAAGLDSDELWIWTDVDGVMTTDPNVVETAQTIETITYREVSEMAYFGAKVLHPKTILPVRDSGTPIRVKNTFNAAHAGTLIVPNDAYSGRPIKAVTAIRNVSMITLDGRNIQGIPGVAGRTFTAVARTDTSIMMISQSSSEQSIFFVVPDARADDVVNALEEEFAEERARGDVDKIQAVDDYGIVTIVGAGMREVPGISARIFAATGSVGVNVVASAHGSSDSSISLAIAEDQLDVALRAIHNQAIMELPV